jgi:hypothetical protein
LSSLKCLELEANDFILKTTQQMGNGVAPLHQENVSYLWRHPEKQLSFKVSKKTEDNERYQQIIK